MHSYNGGEDPNQLRVPYGQSGNNVTGDPTQDMITSLTDSSGTTTAFTFDNDENLQASTAPVNDMQGVSAFGYDPIDRLTSWNYTVGANQGPSDSMKYNVEGLRSFKAPNAGTTGYSLTSGTGQNSFYVYDGDQIIAEIDPVLGGTQNAYLGGATGVSMRITNGNGFVNACEFDPQGNRCGVVQNGQLMGNSLYDGYGQIIADQNDSTVSLNSAYIASDPIGYKGQFGCYTDVESGLVYCQNRYYSPQMGRWLTKDPIGAEGGINVYEFCGNNPIMFADPDGLGPVGVQEVAETTVADGALKQGIKRGLSEIAFKQFIKGVAGPVVAAALVGWDIGSGLNEQFQISASYGGMLDAANTTGLETPNYRHLTRLWHLCDDDGKALLEWQYPFLAHFAAQYRFSSPVEVHHMLPLEFEPWFTRQGLNIHAHEFLLTLPRGKHKDVHGRGTGYNGSWNWEWRQFIRRNENASPSEIRAFLAALRQKFGI